MRIARNRGIGRTQLGWSRLSLPLQASLGGLGNSYSTNRASRRRPEDPWLHHQHSIGRSGNCLSYIWGSCSRHQRRPRRSGARRTRRHRPLLLLQVWTKWHQPNQVWRKVLLFDPKLRASLGEVPSPKSTVSLYLLSIKIDKNFQNKIKIYWFIFLFHDAR